MSDKRPMHQAVPISVDVRRAEVLIAALSMYEHHLRKGAGHQFCGGGIPGPGQPMKHMESEDYHSEQWWSRAALCSEILDELYQGAQL